MMKIDPEKNCHEYCPMGKCCRWLDGVKGFDPDECVMRYKLEDLMQDAILEKESYEEGEDW